MIFCEFCKIFQNIHFKEHVKATTSKTITSAKHARPAKERLQVRKDYKGKMNNIFFKLADTRSITISSQVIEAVIRRFFIKGVFKNCTKLT